ncbi:hypothetical protein ACTA71_003256 [Dictyostelium dimigraforme]
MEYDNKCSIHKEHDIKLICLNCKVVICDGCIVDDHHSGHKFDFIKAENSKPIFEEFKNQHLNNLEKQIDINKELLNKSNTTFKTLEDNHTINLNTVTEEFKELARLLQIVEVDKIKQLVTLYDENKDINTNISTIVDNNLNNINLITNKYKNTINQLNIEQIINNSNNNNKNNNNHQHIEILKHCQQSQLLTKENQNENKINDLMDQYKNVNIVNNGEQVKNSIKDIFEINDSPNITYKIPKNVTIGGQNYFIYKNGNDIPNGTRYVAISPCIKTIQKGSIPATVQYLALLDGFNAPLTEDLLPQSILWLLVGAVKPLLKGSIPNRVLYLFLLDGFNQEISEIPPSVREIFLFDTPVIKFPSFSGTFYKSQRYKPNLTYPNSKTWDCTPWDPIIEL